MIDAQRAQIPDDLLSQLDTAELREFLQVRGWSMSLLEVDEERRRRGIAAVYRHLRQGPRNSSERRHWRRRSIPEEDRDVC